MSLDEYCVRRLALPCCGFVGDAGLVSLAGQAADLLGEQLVGVVGPVGSRDLRRDRELAFCGAEDLTPSGYHGRDDAERARDGARFTVRVARSLVLGG